MIPIINISSDFFPNNFNLLALLYYFILVGIISQMHNCNLGIKYLFLTYLPDKYFQFIGTFELTELITTK